MSVTVYLWFWALLAIGVLALALFRQLLTRGECIILHVRNAEASMVEHQVALARKLDFVERWGKRLTLILGLYSLAVPAYIAALGMQPAGR